jgi:hypothetical protein
MTFNSVRVKENINPQLHRQSQRIAVVVEWVPHNGFSIQGAMARFNNSTLPIGHARKPNVNPRRFRSKSK